MEQLQNNTLYGTIRNQINNNFKECDNRISTNAGLLVHNNGIYFDKSVFDDIYNNISKYNIKLKIDDTHEYNVVTVVSGTVDTTTVYSVDALSSDNKCTLIAFDSDGAHLIYVSNQTTPIAGDGEVVIFRDYYNAEIKHFGPLAYYVIPINGIGSTTLTEEQHTELEDAINSGKLLLLKGTYDNSLRVPFNCSVSNISVQLDYIIGLDSPYVQYNSCVINRNKDSDADTYTVTITQHSINLGNYQTKNDNNLETEDKTIVGAINEINGKGGGSGTPGSKWYNGEGAPSTSTGIDGDYYIDDLTGDVYNKQNNTWSVALNIKGPAGADGAPGAPGEQGEPGTPGAKGDTGVGVPAGGTAGQVLTKKSATDYDTEWKTPSGGGGTVSGVKYFGIENSSELTELDATSGDMAGIDRTIWKELDITPTNESTIVDIEYTSKTVISNICFADRIVTYPDKYVAGILKYTDGSSNRYILAISKDLGNTWKGYRYGSGGDSDGLLGDTIIYIGEGCIIDVNGTLKLVGDDLVEDDFTTENYDMNTIILGNVTFSDNNELYNNIKENILMYKFISMSKDRYHLGYMLFGVGVKPLKTSDGLNFIPIDNLDVIAYGATEADWLSDTNKCYVNISDGADGNKIVTFDKSTEQAPEDTGINIECKLPIYEARTSADALYYFKHQSSTTYCNLHAYKVDNNTDIKFLSSLVTAKQTIHFINGIGDIIPNNGYYTNIVSEIRLTSKFEKNTRDYCVALGPAESRSKYMAFFGDITEDNTYETKFRLITQDDEMKVYYTDLINYETKNRKELYILLGEATNAEDWQLLISKL